MMCTSQIHSNTMASSNKSPRIAPLRPRQSLFKERFPVYFNAFKPQAYSENPSARGGAAYTKYVCIKAEFTRRAWPLHSLPFLLIAHNHDSFLASNAANPTLEKYSIRTINWNPFGNLIATGAADKTLRVCKSCPLILNSQSHHLLTRSLSQGTLSGLLSAFPLSSRVTTHPSKKLPSTLSKRPSSVA